MSIQTEEGTEIVRLPSFWSSLFKIALWAAPVTATTLCGLLAWAVGSIIDHDRRLAIAEFQLNAVYAQVIVAHRESLTSRSERKQ